MNVLDFAMEVVAVSASGVLAPGPLFFMNLLFGSRFGMPAGLKVANGHAVVEVSLIVFLAAGLITFDSARNYSDIIAIIGGVAILAFAALQIGSIFWEKSRFAHNATVDFVGSKSPFVGGIVLTAFNPFFLIWWFTVGLKVILDSAMFGFTTGLAILLAFHIWMDYAWLSGTAYLAFKGSKLLSSRYYPILIATLSTVLVYYGIGFIIQGS
jgi:threonine/homoserine/homoserine lactone efflux protein